MTSVVHSFVMGNPSIINCSNGESIFKGIVDPHWPDLRSRASFHRICSLMRLMGVATAIREELDCTKPANKRFSREANALKRRLQKSIKVQFVRLSFFSKAVTRSSPVDADDDEFLGFVVIAGVIVGELPARNYVFESVVREFGVSTEADLGPWRSFLHVKRSFRCPVVNDTFSITGTFFCQQNTITNVCAHACTAMLLNNCRDVNALVTAEDINALLGIDHKNRLQLVEDELGSNNKATHEGLYPREIARVLREHGFTPSLLDFASTRRRAYREFIYGFVESGYPALLTFNSLKSDGQTISHVVAVVGHSLNRQSWFPAAHACYAKQCRKEKPYLASLNWVDDFLVHDDNFGVQLYLPAHSFRPEDYPDAGPEFMPTQAIGIFPAAAKVSVHSVLAEGSAWDALNALYGASEPARASLARNYYVNHLRPHITGELDHPQTAVLRTSLVPREAYLEHLESSKDSTDKVLSDSDIQSIREVLADLAFVWLVEVTEPELYVANSSKVLEVIVDPTLDPHKLEPRDPCRLFGVRLIRLPHLLLKVQGGGKENYVPLKYHGVDGHMPLFRLEKRSSSALGLGES